MAAKQLHPTLYTVIGAQLQNRFDTEDVSCVQCGVPKIASIMITMTIMKCLRVLAHDELGMCRGDVHDSIRGRGVKGTTGLTERQQ